MRDERTRISGYAPDWLYRLRRIRKAKSVRIFGIKLFAHHAGVPADACDMILRSHYRWQARRMLGDVIKPNDRIIEVGAGFGFLALLAARIVGPTSIRAYEPCRTACLVAQDNFHLNRQSIELSQTPMDENALKIFHPTVLIFDLNKFEWNLLLNADLENVNTVIFEVSADRISQSEKSELRKQLSAKGFKYNRNYENVHAWTRVEKTT